MAAKPTAIEIRLDAASEAAIRIIWHSASVYYGTDYLLRNKVVPHVALLVSDQGLADVFSSITVPDMQIAFHGVGFFVSGQIAFLEVAENAALRAYHQMCFDAAMARAVPIHRLYLRKPGNPTARLHRIAREIRRCLWNLNLL